MNIHFGKQSQFELFPGTTGDPIENTAPRFIFSRIVLSFENVVVIFVFVLVSWIIAFSLGVESGRDKSRIARAQAQPITVAPVTSIMPNTKIHLFPELISKGGTDQSSSGSSGQLDGQQAIAAVIPEHPLNPERAENMPKGVNTDASEKDVDKGYTIQVASYKKQTLADKEQGILKRQGLESFTSIKGNYVIVCVGRYAERDRAEQMLNKLKKRYKDSILRSF